MYDAAACMLQQNFRVDLVDLAKKVPEQTLKNIDAKYAVTPSGSRQQYSTTSTPSPCPAQIYYSSSTQPQEAATICSTAASTSTAVAVV